MFIENSLSERVGKVMGFLAAYAFFTSVLFFVLSFLQKLPPSWKYGHLMLITGSVYLLGSAVQRGLR